MDVAVDRFFSNTKRWKEEMSLLREIARSCKLEETCKWMHPCYCIGDRNIVLIHGFKEYCALLFFKGVLLKDSKQLLIQQTKNVQDRRQLRFTSVDEIIRLRKTITAYIKEAIDIEQAGQKVVFKATAAFDMPEELRAALNKNKKLNTAFNSLTPGRQRGYLLYFAAAKQSATRISRIEKYIPQIMAGKGLHD